MKTLGVAAVVVLLTLCQRCTQHTVMDSSMDNEIVQTLSEDSLTFEARLLPDSQDHCKRKSFENELETEVETNKKLTINNINDQTNNDMGSCVDGFVEIEGTCYGFSQWNSWDPVPMETARLYCNYFDGDLASLGKKTASEADPVMNYIRANNLADSRPLWLGARRIEDYQYQWLDGRNLSGDSYMWKFTQPDGPDWDQDCVIVYSGWEYNDNKRHYMYDIDCNQEYNFLCEYPLTKVSIHTPDQTNDNKDVACNDGFVEIAGRCYYFSAQHNMDPCDAFNSLFICDQLHADIASLGRGSLSDADPLMNYIRDHNLADSRPLYLGARTDLFDEHFYWSDGRHFSIDSYLWTYWKPDHCEDCNCTAVYSGWENNNYGKRHYMADTRCTERYNFVCEQW